MPLPTPTPGESRSEFMTRCMDSETMRQEFPEPEQRTAVCSSQWERKDASQARSAWIVRALTYPVMTGMIVLVGLAGCATAQDHVDSGSAMIPALLVFFCFCCALFVWLWERIEGEGTEYDD